MRILFLLLVSALSALGQNILENSSFEGGNLRGWSYGAYGEQETIPLAFATNVAFHGSHSIRMEYRKTGITNKIGLVSRLYKLKPSTAYTLTFYAKFDPDNPTAAANNNLKVLVNNSGTAESVFAGQIITTNWVRYTKTFTTTNVEGGSTYYIFVVPHNAEGNGSDLPGNFCNSDAFQLEEGSAATAYAPISALEIGGQSDFSAPANIFFEDEQSKITLLSFNGSGSSTNATVKWRLTDYWNSLKSWGSELLAFPAGNSTNTINMPAVGRGMFRCLLWVDGLDESINEVTYGVVAHPVTLSARTNSFFGTHMALSEMAFAAAQRMGIHWTRDFYSYRWDYAEPTEGAYVYERTNITRVARDNYDIETLAILGAVSWSVPTFAHDLSNPSPGSYYPSNILWSNFVFNVVSTYKPWVKYWEIWNESSNTNGFTNIVKFMKGAARAADSTSILLGPVDYYEVTGGAVLDIVGPSYYWDIWSTHVYPDPVYDYYKATNTARIMADHGITHGINSETGLRSDSFYATGLWEDVLTAGALPSGVGFQRHYRQRNPRMQNNFLSLMVGPFKQYYYYDDRASGGFNGIVSYSLTDFNNTIKPSGIVYAAMAQMLDGGASGGKFAISGNTNCFIWTRNNQCIVTVMVNTVVATNTSESLKLTTSLAGNQFSVYDSVANPIAYNAGIPIGIDPIYFVGAAGVATNTVISSLSLDPVADTQAPNVSIVTWPTATNHSRFTWRWTAEDNCSVDTRDVVVTNAIQYAYQLVGVDLDYGIWTNLSRATYTNLPLTSNWVFNVKARDATGNIALASTENGGMPLWANPTNHFRTRKSPSRTFRR